MGGNESPRDFPRKISPSQTQKASAGDGRLPKAHIPPPVASGDPFLWYLERPSLGCIQIHVFLKAIRVHAVSELIGSEQVHVLHFAAHYDVSRTRPLLSSFELKSYSQKAILFTYVPFRVKSSALRGLDASIYRIS